MEKKYFFDWLVDTEKKIGFTFFFYRNLIWFKFSGSFGTHDKIELKW